MPDSTHPWLEWGLTRSAAAAGFTDSAELAIAQTINVDDTTSGNADEGQASTEKAGAAKAKKRHFRVGAALAATALAAVAVIAIGISAHLASASNSSRNTALGNTARSTTAKRHPVAPATSKTAAASTSAVRVTRSRASAPAHSSANSSAPSAAAPSPPPPSPSLAPVVLLSQGRSVTASSIQGYPWAAANAVDGNLNTRWSSAFSDPQWLEVDVGTIHAIREVVLYWENAHATAFQIQTSNNGTTWVNIYATTTGAGGEQMIEVNGTGRYVRMYGTHRNTQYGYSLWEFQVIGS
jgi:hypothetical protein